MTSNHESQTERLGRRKLLKEGLIWGGAGTTAFAFALASATVAAATGDEQEHGKKKSKKRGKHVTFDVACLEKTFGIIFAPGALRSGDLRGSTFSAEGSMVPAGYHRRRWFRPESAEAIGRWLCRGWFLLNEDRPEPHVVTTQEYILEEIRPGWLYPPDQLTWSGTKGADDHNKQAPIRSVTGRTGRYLGAKGEVYQHGLGTNTTTLAPPEVPAPNFRFRFKLNLTTPVTEKRTAMRRCWIPVIGRTTRARAIRLLEVES